MPDAVLAVQEEQSGTGHAVRVAMEALGEDGRRRHRARGLRRHPAADRREPARLRRRPRGGPAGGEHPQRHRRRAVRLRPRAARRRGRRRGDRRGEGRHAASSARSARSTPGSSPSTPRSSSRRCPGSATTTPRASTTSPTPCSIAREDGLTVGAFPIDDVMQTEGANDRVQLAELGRELNQRIVTRWMRDGVTVMDPATTWIDADVVLAQDVTILPGVPAARRDRRRRGRRDRPGHHAQGLRDRRGRPGGAHARRARGRGGRRERRPVLLPAPRHQAGRRAARSAASSRPRTR